MQMVRATVVRYVRLVRLGYTDLLPFYDLAKTDLLLQSAVKEFNGLRNVGIPNLFEAICWGIIGQQINLTYAYTLKRRFVENFGMWSVKENNFGYSLHHMISQH